MRMSNAGLAVILLLGPGLAAVRADAQQQTGSPAGVPVPPPPAASAPAVSANAAPESNVFRIRVVDGRSGAAMVGAHVKLWYDEPSGPGYEFATDPRGYALMPQPVGDPVRVVGKVTDYIDCRRQERGAPPEGYSLQAIAKSGMAGENACGNAAVRIHPGELVLYVRPSRWYEGINRGVSQTP